MFVSGQLLQSDVLELEGVFAEVTRDGRAREIATTVAASMATLQKQRAEHVRKIEAQEKTGVGRYGIFT